MPVIHFVYAGDPHSDVISAPTCITRNMYNFLLKKCAEIPDLSFQYYDWNDKRVIDSAPDDILIGHPNYDPDTIVQRSFRESTFKAKFTIHPIHTRMVECNMPFDHLTRVANAFFGICGPYWYDTILDTPFAHWKPKMVRLDLAVDTDQFPPLKQSFRVDVDRRFLYIGNSTKHKNLGYLAQIMQAMPERQLHWYGGSNDHPLARLPNVHVTGHVKLDAEMGSKICSETDMMINVSSSDANPTTLLETAAWGLPVACTAGSGYYNGWPFYEIPENDVQTAVATLRSLITLPESALIRSSKDNIQLVRDNYTWDNFCYGIWNILADYL